MSSIKAFRFQLRVKPAQQRQLQRWAGGLRWVWNQALDEQRARHARGERYASYVDMAKWLTAWRNAPDTQWLATGPVHTQQQTLRRLDEAYQRFFAAAKAGQAGGRGRTGPPEFKRRGAEPGIRFPDAKQFSLDAANGRLKCPKRLGVTEPTVLRMERGDPSVSMAVYATALWLIGRSADMASLSAPEKDLGALEADVRKARSRSRRKTQAPLPGISAP